jgi:transcriptional regulator GlxA family with amidase domain
MATVPITAPAPAPRHYTFVLLAEFTMLTFAGAIEVLRIANRVAGRTIYSWSLAADGGLPVRCSNGISITVDTGLGEMRRDDIVLVCGGVNIHDATSKRLLNWLRREARRGVTLGGLCTAAYALARAGLLDGKTATIHWDHQDSFAEDFAQITLSRSLFVIDGNRITTAGGTASIDLMLTLIATDHGDDLAALVADQVIHSVPRADQDAQRPAGPARIGVRHPKLAQVIRRMEHDLEEPISPSLLAQEVGMSTRQLERLFRRYLNRSPKRYYMEIRLGKARNLLTQTDMSVINVALACGFASPSHFSKCYRAHFNTTPYRDRASQTAP